MKTLLFICALCLSAILISLIPLKIWRSHILANERLLYIPSQSLESRPGYKASLNIGVFLPDDHKPYVDTFGSPIFPKILELPTTNAEILKTIAPDAKTIQVKHYWKNATFGDQVTDGLFDRVDDFSFWNTFGATVNVWLLFICAARVRKNYPSCYEDLRLLKPPYWLLAIVLGLSWVGFMAYTHGTKEHGILHGGPWTADTIPGIRATQIVDFYMFCAAGVFAGIVFAAKIQIFMVMNHRDNRRYFSNYHYLFAWEHFINAGYFTFLVMSILGPFILFFDDFVISLDKARYVLIFLVYQLPLLVVTFIAWLKTRERVRYTLVDVPWLIWISTKKPKDD